MKMIMSLAYKLQITVSAFRPKWQSKFLINDYFLLLWPSKPVFSASFHSDHGQ